MRKRNESKRKEKHKNLLHKLDVIDELLLNSFPEVNHEEMSMLLRNENHIDIPFFYCDVNSHLNFKTQCDVSSNRINSEKNIDWDAIHHCIDPESGELDIDRCNRKRNQISSLVNIIEREIEHLMINRPSTGERPLTIVDFGAGSGHLGLLIACRNPKVHVILAERKEYSVNVARQRINLCQIQNVSIYNQDIRNLFDKESSLIDFEIGMGVSLHSCGLLTDIAIQLCVASKAPFVITPCCYGQIAKPPSDYCSIIASNEIALRLHRSKIVFQRDVSAMEIIASGADFSIGFESDFEHKEEFCLAKRCMRAIDIDRAIRVCESNCFFSDETQLSLEKPEKAIIDNGRSGYYTCSISSLRPITCSPKNNIIIGRFCNYIS